MTTAAPARGTVRLKGRKSSNTALGPLIKIFHQTHAKADVAAIQKAFAVAERMHDGQMRKSGDPYITHPLAVATILAELGMTAPTLCAALLHDTVEDMPYTLEQLSVDFGDEVAHLVDGVIKLDKVKYGDSAQSETIRKMVVAMSRDIRVLVIKLADRLHNMRTLRYLRQDKQERIARETMEIFAPLAHRLGMNTIKWELEDIAFATLHPKVYDEIVRLVADRAPSRGTIIKQLTGQARTELDSAGIRADLSGRVKSYYSIYQKMLVGGREFSEIFDLAGVRILVNSVADCYGVLGLLHARWSPIPGQFKDYISVPTFNMYQSLHTTVIGPQGRVVELQIRTYAMHRRAEYAISTDRKDGDSRARTSDATSTPAWLREALDWSSQTDQSVDFLDSLRFGINNARVYAYTPRGDLVQLPTDATPVDFAYAVHTEVGHACIGARVNGRLMSLESTLESGDVVEIFTSKAQDVRPSPDWLDTIKSRRARRHIRDFIRRMNHELQRDSGSERVKTRLANERLSLRYVDQSEHDALARKAGHATFDHLLMAASHSDVVLERVVNLVRDLQNARRAGRSSSRRTSRRRRQTKLVPLRSGRGMLIVSGVGFARHRTALCCKPLPGQPVLALMDASGMASTHTLECARASRPRLRPTHWVGSGELPDWARGIRFGLRLSTPAMGHLEAELRKREVLHLPDGAVVHHQIAGRGLHTLTLELSLTTLDDAEISLLIAAVAGSNYVNRAHIMTLDLSS